MDDERFSRTAQVMAFFRALESARPASVRLLEDPLAMAVLPRAFRDVVRLSRFKLPRRIIDAFIDRRWPGARTSAIARTRLIDDWLTTAVREGASQVVLLGAGFDSRAWRLQALSRAAVFEIDHPATSREKRNRLVAAQLDPSRIVQVTVDFERESLTNALVTGGFNRQCRTAVIWEGVTNYLTEAAVAAILRWVGGLAPGSALAFTYVHAGLLSDPTSFDGGEDILAAVAEAGETWTYGIDPGELGTRLQADGLVLIEDLGADEYRSRYWQSATGRWRGYAFYHAARAAVPEHAKA